MVRRLSEVTTKIGSGATPRGGNVSYKQEGLSLIRSLNVHDLDFRTKDLALIDDTQADALSNVIVEPRDVLLNITGASIARCTVVPTEVLPARVNQHVSIIRPMPQKLDSDFLAYLLVSQDVKKRLLGIGDEGGSTRQALTKAQLQQFPIALPPLEEQRRIVAVLDEAFEGLTRASAHAEANLQNAREFYTTILRDTFRNGSDKWQNDLPPDTVSVVARNQTTRTRDATQTGGRVATLRPMAGPFSLAVLHPSLPARTGWRWSQLTDLARLESGHTPSRKHPEYWGGDVPWVGIKDARDHHGGEVHDTLENTNPLGIAKSSARILPARTVCLSRTASVGYVTIMGRDMATSQDFVNWICGDALLPEFLQLLLLAQGDDIRRFASGSVHQTIYFPEVKAFHICHPPVAVQKEVCDVMEAVRDKAQSLIRAYEERVSAIDALRQSLLQKAFAGELT